MPTRRQTRHLRGLTNSLKTHMHVTCEGDDYLKLKSTVDVEQRVNRVMVKTRAGIKPVLMMCTANDAVVPRH